MKNPKSVEAVIGRASAVFAAAFKQQILTKETQMSMVVLGATNGVQKNSVKEGLKGAAIGGIVLGSFNGVMNIYENREYIKEGK